MFVICLAPLALGGCYERVVSSSGMGATSADVQGPYRSETAADRAFDRLVKPDKPVSRSQRWVDPGSRNPGDRP
jgi:hypothetical protein